MTSPSAKQNLYYTSYQYQEAEDPLENSLRNQDDDKVFAKALVTGFSNDVKDKTPKYYEYYIRLDHKTLHDPFPRYSASNNKTSYADKVCTRQTTYKKVTKPVFDQYLLYLRTENHNYYKQANKGIING
jgi:hypothetical protein